MKKLLKVYDVPKGLDLALLVVRVSIGVMMLTHGLPKMMNLFSGEPVQFISFMWLTPALSLSLAIFAEVFCSILLIVGFATRYAVIPLIITMLIAVFVVHINDPFIKQEMALHYLLIYVVLLFTGSGRYSLDQVISSRLPAIAYQRK